MCIKLGPNNGTAPDNKKMYITSREGVQPAIAPVIEPREMTSGDGQTATVIEPPSNNVKYGQKWNTNDTSNDKNSVISPAIVLYPPYETSNDHQQSNNQSRLAQLRHTITGPNCTTNDRVITGILVPCEPYPGQ
jgi:hypothetical protein